MYSSIPKFDLVALVLAGSSIVLYFLIVLGVFMTDDRSKLTISKSLINLELWALKHSSKIDAQSVTLAVQTFRNTILVAIFTGGSSFQFAITILSGMEKTDAIETKVGNVITAGLLMCSFLNWACVMRYSAHASFLVGVLHNDETDGNNNSSSSSSSNASSSAAARPMLASIPPSSIVDPSHQHDVGETTSDLRLEHCKGMLRRMSIHFNLGFRFIFFSIPFGFYNAGPVALLVSLGLVFGFIAVFDYPLKPVKRRIH